jgi:hypothetical protein
MIDTAASIVLVFYAFFAAELIHEIGHVAILKIWFSDVPIHLEGFVMVVGENQMYRDLRRWQKDLVYAAGIIAGFLMIVPTFFVVEWYYSLTLAIIYLLGCKHDLLSLLLRGDTLTS